MPQIITLTHSSSVLRGNPLGDPYQRDLPVYLPPGYDDSDAQRYPVIWVLAPFTSWGERYFNLKAWDENIIQRADRLITAGQAQPVIMAFPDCFTRFGGSQYVNSSAVGQYADYITQELVPFLDEQLRTLPERDHRGVMGYSSGGFGALSLAMQYPQLFGAAASHAGDMGFLMAFLGDIPGAIRTLERYGSVAAFLETIGQREVGGSDWFSALNLIAMSACYSPNPASADGFDLPFDRVTGELLPQVWGRWLAHDPVEQAAQHLDVLKDLRLLYFDAGNRDEYNLHLGARRLHRLLDENDVSHIYEEFDGGHRSLNWRYETSLPLITDAVTGAPSADA